MDYNYHNSLFFWWKNVRGPPRGKQRVIFFFFPSIESSFFQVSFMSLAIFPGLYPPPTGLRPKSTQLQPCQPTQELCTATVDTGERLQQFCVLHRKYTGSQLGNGYIGDWNLCWCGERNNSHLTYSMLSFRLLEAQYRQIVLNLLMLPELTSNTTKCIPADFWITVQLTIHACIRAAVSKPEIRYPSLHSQQQGWYL